MQAPCLLHMSHSHTHAYGGAAQLKVGYLTVMSFMALGFELRPV